MARRRNDNEYRPTFQVSGYGRPVTQRLTPLTYICLAIAGFFLVFGIVVLLGNVTGYSPSDLARRIGLARDPDATKNSTPTVPTAIVAAVNPALDVQSASTATPAPVKPRTPTPVRPTATPRPTSTPRPTREVVAQQPTPEPAEIPSAELAPNAEGELMASEPIVKRTERDVRAYFEALIAHKSPQAAYKDLVEDSDGFLSKYFEGEALRTIKASVSQENSTC